VPDDEQKQATSRPQRARTAPTPAEQPPEAAVAVATDAAPAPPAEETIPVAYLIPRAEALLGVPSWELQGALVAAQVTDEQITVSAAKAAVESFNPMRAPSSQDLSEEA